MTTEAPLKIGILAVQGGVAEHAAMLSRLGATPVEVLTPEHLRDLDGLILPGGESTAIGKLMAKTGLTEPLRARVEQGLPVYGTCAGMILLARRAADRSAQSLSVMDIRVKRNAYGAQAESFEADVRVSGLGDNPVRAIFIRAPVVEEVGPGVEVLAATVDGTPVLVREGTMLASAFHPELGDDTRVHRLFVEMCRRSA
jgi:5'-phosphate synthase pdxT subunit